MDFRATHNKSPPFFRAFCPVFTGTLALFVYTCKKIILGNAIHSCYTVGMVKQQPRKKQHNFRLAPDVAKLLEKLAKHHKMEKTALVETLIRKAGVLKTV